MPGLRAAAPRLDRRGPNLGQLLGNDSIPVQHPFRRGRGGGGHEEQSGGQIGCHFLIRLPFELVRPAGEMWLVSSGLGELEPLGLRAMALDLLRASLPVGGQALTL